MSPKHDTPDPRDCLILTRSGTSAASYCARGLPALAVTLAGDGLAFPLKAARVLFANWAAVESHDHELADEVTLRGCNVVRLP